MAYPDIPDNRLIIKMDEYEEHNIDLFEKFHMFLVDGYTVNPPEVKKYEVDIPGGNGKLDLTESLFGDCAYQNRQYDFTFYIVDVKDTMELEQIKTQVHNFIHGKEFDYIWTIDPEYTYHGRFTVSDLSHEKYANVDIAHQMKISVDTEPFKHKKPLEYQIDALGGVSMNFQSGRERVKPVFESDGYLKVICNGKQAFVKGKGVYTFNNIYFEEGMNVLYVCSHPVYSLSWGWLFEHEEKYHDPAHPEETKTRKVGITWGGRNGLGSKRLYEWYKINGLGGIVFPSWGEIYRSPTNLWRDHADETYNQLVYTEDWPTVRIRNYRKWNELPSDSTWKDYGDDESIIQIWSDFWYDTKIPLQIKNVKMSYEWGDL